MIRPIQIFNINESSLFSKQAADILLGIGHDQSVRSLITPCRRRGIDPAVAVAVGFRSCLLTGWPIAGSGERQRIGGLFANVCADEQTESAGSGIVALHRPTNDLLRRAVVDPSRHNPQCWRLHVAERATPIAPSLHVDAWRSQRPDLVERLGLRRPLPFSMGRQVQALLN